ncbi:MAG: phosphoserine phosphatase SerB [Sphingomicrobium sp.]
MTIATLIAAGRLDERLLEAAMDRLADAGIASGTAGWIDPGDAIDLDVAGEARAIRSALEGWEGVDIIPHAAAQRAVRLFVADMDSTMIGQECIDELADYAGVKPEVAAITEQAMSGELDFAGALAARVALLAGLDEGVIAQCLAERVRPNPGAATLVGTLAARGTTTVLVTGGFTAFADPIGEGLGYGYIHANRLEIEEGKLTGRTIGPIVDGARKAAVLEESREVLDLGVEQTMAIGDGANDSAMIQAAGLGIGYRPKPALAAVADAVLLYHPLDALLWALGIPRSDWLVRD